MPHDAPATLSILLAIWLVLLLVLVQAFGVYGWQAREVVPMIGQLVRVRWLDAWFDFETEEAAFLSEFPVETIGYLVREGDVLSVAAEKLPNGWRAITHIPRALVKSVHALEDGTLGVLVAPM